jgi:hypothetical protein
VVKSSRLITYVFVAICYLKSVSIVSQFEDTLVIQPKLDTSYSKKEEKNLKFFLGFDARRSFVLKNNSKFNGIKIGLSYKNKHRFGLGLYGMQEPITFVGEVDRFKHPDATDTVRFNFGYGSLFYEYVWLKNKRWDLSTPIHFGIGNLAFSYKDTSSLYKPLFGGGVLMTELTGVAQFKVFRWFALGSGVGYRMMLIDDITIRKSLNSPVYIFQVKILFGEIYKMTFRRKNLEEWK